MHLKSHNLSKMFFSSELWPAGAGTQWVGGCGKWNAGVLGCWGLQDRSQNGGLRGAGTQRATNPHRLLLFMRWLVGSKFSVSQAECVANDRHGTQAHGRARDHGTQEQAEERIKHASGNRDTERIIDKRKEKVLPDVAHHRTTQGNGLDDAAQVAFDERNARAL